MAFLPLDQFYDPTQVLLPPPKVLANFFARRVKQFPLLPLTQLQAFYFPLLLQSRRSELISRY
jgi:hypothetical protein